MSVIIYILPANAGILFLFSLIFQAWGFRNKIIKYIIDNTYIVWWIKKFMFKIVN